MKLISFSVWGNDPMYKLGMLENLKLKEYYYPEWEVIVYVAKNISGERWVQGCRNMGARIAIMPEEEQSWKMSLWRYLPCFDNWEAVIIRDADSRFTLREKAAVDEWLQSNKTIHVMRDHPFHNEKIMGGMCGFKMNSLDQTIFNEHFANGQNERLIAERMLERVYEEKKSEIYFNVSHNAMEGEEWNPFIERKLGEFVGEIFDQNNNRHPEHYKQVLQE